MNRMERFQRWQKDRRQTVAAALGVVSVPGEAPQGESTNVKRIPATLEDLARRPRLWVMWLTDAMLRTGRGCRTVSLKRQPPKGASGFRPTEDNPRRADKDGPFGSKLERALLRSGGIKS